MNISSIGSSMNMYMEQPSGMGNRPKPSDPFEKADEDGSGSLDETEFSELATHLSEMTGEEVDSEELFATYDEDGDGTLSEEETEAFMEDNRPEGPPPGGMGPPPEEGGDLSEIFSNADEDEDGYLDETETETIAEMISNATGEATTAEELIEAYDEDGDGVLSEAEGLAALEENRPNGPPPGGMGPPPEDEDGEDLLTSILEDADEDEDGYLDETETETIAEMISNATGEATTAEELIEAYDEDGDGVLSESEGLAALEENRPDGPPPTQNNYSGYQNGLFGNMTGVESYLNIASLAMQSGQTNMANAMTGQPSSLFSTGSLYSYNA